MRGFMLVICLAAFVTLVANAQEAKKPSGPVKCYVCNSLNKGQENCSSSDETVLAPFLKTCPKITEGQLAGRPATMCRKVLQEVHKEESVVRECSYTGEEELDGKRRIGNKGIILYLYQCENEGVSRPFQARKLSLQDKACNSATGSSSIVALAFALVAAAVSQL